MTIIDRARDALKQAEPIRDAPGYFVTREGEVLSAKHNWRGYGVRFITPTEGKSGYLKVRLSVGGKRVNRTVHRLVAEAYLEERPEGFQVRHLDGNKLNNAAENLQWGSAEENAADRESHGKTIRGERMWNSVLTEELVREIRRLRDSGLTYREIEEITGVGRTNAREVAVRRSWAHVS